MFTNYATTIICTKDILKFLNLGEGVKKLSSMALHKMYNSCMWLYSGNSCCICYCIEASFIIH